ncbi:MAG: phenylalanine--tRNA ligase subunit alpha, partial [Clostridiaceae bacterium]|nr:phenylalanine--tRNA ligase subunit alpha [Clostridiaceae bacterium]
MLDELIKVREDGLAAVDAAADRSSLDEVRQSLLGRKGLITELLKSVGKRPAEQRRSFGQDTNQIKKEVTEAIDKKEDELLSTASLFSRPADLTVPGIMPQAGSLHPITQMSYDLNDAFRSLGFEVY